MHVLNPRPPHAGAPAELVGWFDLQADDGLLICNLKLVDTPHGPRVRSPGAFGQAIVKFDRAMSDRIVRLAHVALGAVTHAKRAA